MKPYYSCAYGELYKGDCLEVMESIYLIENSIDLIMTDIPYGEVNRDSNGLRSLDKETADVFDLDLDLLMHNLVKYSKGSLYVFCGTKQLSDILRNFTDNKLSSRVIVWEKTNPSPMNGKNIWLSGVELCAFGKKKNATFNEHCKNTVLRFPTARKNGHPTPKPVALFEKLIEVSSNKGDTVLDPFAGSSSTAIACINTNRKFIMIEKEEKYCEISANRIEEHINKMWGDL